VHGPAPPLRLTKLVASTFRNLTALELAPAPRFNVIHGDNGQGKSNLLEAIDYLGCLRSFRGATTAELIAKSASRAELRAEVRAEGPASDLRAVLSRTSARQLQLDGKRPRRKANYFKTVQMVLFHPGDMMLVAGPPELRRGYVDRILQHFDATYSATLDAYERALRSRNRLLRAESPNLRAIVSYDEMLASAGAIVGSAREQLLIDMAPLVRESFRNISGEGLALRVEYAPRVEPTVEALRAALQGSLQKDLARGFTAEGPHADELALELDGTPAKRFGSQGQHRAIVLALKVAELHELTRRVSRVPILLLDDVSSELDKRRSRRLFELLAELGGQVFLTTTHPEYILLDRDRVDYRMEDGTLIAAS
jgi:DNA replication and repair protein RecF